MSALDQKDWLEALGARQLEGQLRGIVKCFSLPLGLSARKGAAYRPGLFSTTLPL